MNIFIKNILVAPAKGMASTDKKFCRSDKVHVWSDVFKENGGRQS